MVRVGLIGLGNFGRLHARILTNLGSVELVAVCDPDPKARKWATETLNVPLALGTVDEMFAQQHLDALYIVSPEDLHTDHALRALDMGVPVFMEKPLSTTAANARHIVEKANASNTYVQIGFVLRFDSQHAIVRSQIAADTFGDVIVLRAKRNCSQDWFALYGNRAHTVFETIIHDIDLALWWTGSRARSVFARSRNVSGLIYPDALIASIELQNGTLVTLETSWLVPDHAPKNVLAGDWTGTIDAEFELIGTRATAKYSLLDAGLSILTNDELQSPQVGLWPEVYGSIGGALRLEDEHFIECVRRGESSPIANLDQALHGLEIAEAIMTSAELGQVVTL